MLLEWASWDIRDERCSSWKRGQNRWWKAWFEQQGRAACFKLVKTSSLGTGFGFNSHEPLVVQLSLSRGIFFFLFLYQEENWVTVSTMRLKPRSPGKFAVRHQGVRGDKWGQAGKSATGSGSGSTGHMDREGQDRSLSPARPRVRDC